MAQPETAAEEAVAPDSAPEDVFESLAEELLGEEEQEEEEETAESEPDEGEPEEEEGIGEDEPDLPAIDPPHSLTAEEKEAFKTWPREAQEAISRRVGDLEKGFQTKAQEAAQAREAARAEALQFAAQLKAEAVDRLSAYAQQFEVRPPDASLFSENPQAYARQLEAYQHYTAQREQAQRDAQRAEQDRQQYLAELQQHEAKQFHQRLQSELPDAFDASGQLNKGFIDTLAATAEVLGYDAHSIDTASVEELKALKAVSELKADADKYRALQKKKMERVRAGKNPPPITKPGTARNPDANKRAKADAAWSAAKSATTRPARESALADWLDQTGFLD